MAWGKIYLIFFFENLIIFTQRYEGQCLSDV